jgi:hypothetical protein
MRDRAEWVIERFADVSDEALSDLVGTWIGEWGAEFTESSVLREDLL